ncbi:response regulator [Microterricola viridarii]|uniref:Nitrate/nitrite response regulator protein n=1 Tax=Microterricola viridarii TaxID=412690 RepID=A0A0Y0NDC6_9MICO|nr:response regulator transcription factor [Microterricola viridarii]AMB57746.1 nitrate/nitrite response regulator protein [Microterricola viridarii]
MNARVLIVDDHPGFREQARRLLELEAFIVVGDTATAEGGVQLASILTPDLILLDVMLPDAVGFDVVPLLREQGAVVIVLISSHDRSDYGCRIELCGADGFIPKDELSGESLRQFVA